MTAPPARSARFALRDATAEAHQAVEAGFSTLDLRKVDDYRTFLSRLAAAFLPLETALEAGGITRFLPDWPHRRRRDLLTQDLADLGAVVVPLDIPPLPRDAPALLGTAYVLEGSRLGGRAILSGFGPETDPRVRAATRFLTPEAGTPRLWASLLASLEHHLPNDAARSRAAFAANLAFACFGRAQQPAPSSPRTAVLAHA